MATEIQEIKETIEQLKVQTTRILYYLEDDSQTSRQGFISKLDLLERKLDGILEREKIFKAKATVWGMVGAALFSGALWIVKLLLTR